MCKNIGKFILIGAISSCISVTSYAADKTKQDYQQPNYNDPSKPNYISGTRTDMAPKVNVDYEQENKKKDYNCVPSQEIQKEVVDAYDSRYDDTEAGMASPTVSSPIRVIEASKLWDKACKDQEKESKATKNMPSQSVWGSADR